MIFDCPVMFSRPAVSTFDESPDDEERATKSVIVRGFSSPPSEKLLAMLFKNSKKTGGGEIEALKISQDKKSVKITFKDEQGICAWSISKLICTFVILCLNVSLSKQSGYQFF